MSLVVGYVPLADAAPVIAAAERGFARAEGLTITLSQEPSWATLRDRLALGHLDAAHMLAPLAIASALGRSGPQADLCVPMALNRNGNAITLSNPLWAEMAPASESLDDVAQAFAGIARARAEEGRPLTIGTVHPFSSHSYQLRLFAERGGLDLRRALRLVVVPPPNTVEALKRGIIDGFCVGAPWNSIAVEAGIGRIAALGCAIVPDCAEKVLALPASEAEAGLALVRAVHRAGIWCADPGNRTELAALLADRAGLGPDAALLARVLAGALTVDAGGTTWSEPAYLRLGAETHRPEPDQARWLVEQMAACGQIEMTADVTQRATALYRPDLFAAALSG
ncbi:ABC transporter substrate-binding protein [Methylobacterium organophilum]|uniref:CmpA/NrtA family ABC transporter substrate-binding protein n=1 Tax=Methylobacterium organophilum TaxID=410 RepID=UPI001F12F950|nr:CmpA/NrtA family ABC transporter substrate-binding protein [Methylobacterium organophilum]UMY16116.1 ABC transporter substrate-binding protein [Methylobacterium organophilum]